MWRVYYAPSVDSPKVYRITRNEVGSLAAGTLNFEPRYPERGTRNPEQGVTQDSKFKYKFKYKFKIPYWLIVHCKVLPTANCRLPAE